jgi:uncharacterized protein (DUF1800 family)
VGRPESSRLAAIVAGLALAGCSVAPGGGRDSAGLPSEADAARFLTQATFGPDDATIAQVRTLGVSRWIDQQLISPPGGTHLADLDARLAVLKAASPTAELSAGDFYPSFWKHAATDGDQLRERVTFALSEIFVISLGDSNVDTHGAGAYYDMLGANAFGNFRTLLEQVALHPTMGAYLTWLGNQKEDPATGRHPDENFAREVMQLMTIGLVQLNLDGTPKRDSLGHTIPTYSADDIAGLAKVFTGYSYYSPNPTTVTFRGGNLPADARLRSMIPYPAFHSTSAKSFLGVTIPASAIPDPGGDLKIALDALCNHPNTGPFVARQLIQRLVTSNPSPAYVRHVAQVFNDNGAGVRGDMGAVVKAILTDPEARNSATAQGANFGKVREPIVRLANWMRAFGATSQSGDWLLPSLSANTSLGESPLTSPSVFNFYRPGFSPPNTRIGGAGLVAPEFQVVDEVTTAGYLNTMQSAIDLGIGTAVGGVRDVRANYATELAIANDPSALVDRMDLLLLEGRMPAALRNRILEAVNSIPVPAVGASQTAITTALTNRVKLAIFMAMASSDYMVQR